ncbi:TPA: hypothetical protein QDB07_000809 [Burkholderia vietnamiensis]|nr:hypothetical protein [Burkholderia vietnamiensis]
MITIQTPRKPFHDRDLHAHGLTPGHTLLVDDRGTVALDRIRRDDALRTAQQWGGDLLHALIKRVLDDQRAREREQAGPNLHTHMVLHNVGGSTLKGLQQGWNLTFHGTMDMAITI